MKVGIIGLGFVGGAMEKSFRNKGLESNINLFGYDKYKNNGIGSFESILNTDIVFLALPTPYDDTRNEYDKTSINETCEILNKNEYKGIIVIKSTVEPETTRNLNNKYELLKLVHNPEFLTARTAYEDFHNQKHIILGYDGEIKNIELLINFYKTYYPTAEISLSTSIESESAKIFCNSFYAAKIQIMTELYLLCKANNSDYNKIKSMMLKNGWINPMHTTIPGPDGNISYGGLCFPKDTNALNKYMIKYNSPNLVLSSVIKERNNMRDDHDNCK
jgi:UDPglucose 6-dehydrogenase